MKKYLVSWIIFQIISGQIAYAQVKNFTKEPLTNSIFWEITGKNLTRPSYLFGTHHLYDYEFLKLSEPIQKKFPSVDVVFGEIVMDSTDMNLMLKAAMAMVMKDNTLDQLLTAEQFEQTDRVLKDVTDGMISAKMLNKFKPMVVQQMIMIGKFVKAYQKDKSQFQLNNGISGASNSMDIYFQTFAKQLGKELEGLETVDDQLKVLFDSYSLQRQVEMLMEVVQDKAGFLTQELNQMNTLYQQQNLNGLLELMQRSMKKEEIKTLLIDRNLKWIPVLEKTWAKGKSAFIAVGAGHLPGEFGIINLLRKKGYTVTPIPITVPEMK
ncbi:MAG: TraB/GumN family protein [Microscillaceae bacterium]|nr:TraB/GumN family protein [Microscillaceae bacterium]MDW8460950.1 TraB/GumN family protein [Cytophagales bacterium]